MTTITAKFRGKHEDLEMLILCAIKNISTKTLIGNSLIVSWIFESNDKEQALTESMDSVNMRQVDLWNCEVEFIG